MMNLGRVMMKPCLNGRHLRVAVLAAMAASPASALSQVVPAPSTVQVQAAPAVTLEQIPGVTIQYYNVSGTSIPLLRASVEAQRPKNAAGQAMAADAKWSIGTNVKRQTTGTACKIVGATATFKAQVVLPRLINPQGVVVPAPVMTEWQRYVGSLAQQQAAVLHQVHSRMPEVERAVMASTCEGAGAAANAAIARITPVPAPAPAPVAAPAPAPVPAKKKRGRLG